jgi:hypothetical protein
VSNRGSQMITSPLAFLLKGFFILKYFLEKEGFLKRSVVYNK